MCWGRIVYNFIQECDLYLIVIAGCEIWISTAFSTKKNSKKTPPWVLVSVVGVLHLLDLTLTLCCMLMLWNCSIDFAIEH